MKKNTLAILCSLSCLLPSVAQAWGRHDLIMRAALGSPELSHLQTTRVTPEPIEQAAPDLLARVIPILEKWSTRYHREHDTRYSWTPPTPRPGTNAREALLWSLEDNMKAPLSIPARERSGKLTAADVLIDHVDEPDGILDGELDRPPYVKSLRDRMSVFYGNDAHTHAFRHYYVPSSLLPPILQPRGVAPYRAALYAMLADGAFKTGHPYWGYRFLAWSIHYVQDVTQPWHTIFLPNLSFLSFSKAWMKKEVSALHYLTEAFSDSWMLKELKELQDAPASSPSRALASLRLTAGTAGGIWSSDPWAISELTEKLARSAHAKASKLADLARAFFQPVVDSLNDNLKPKFAVIDFGGLHMKSAGFDFNGNGTGATRFLAPLWQKGFELTAQRDRLIGIIVSQLDAAVRGSRIAVAEVLQNSSSRILISRPNL